MSLDHVHSAIRSSPTSGRDHPPYGGRWGRTTLRVGLQPTTQTVSSRVTRLHAEGCGEEKGVFVVGELGLFGVFQEDGDDVEASYLVAQEG